MPQSDLVLLPNPAAVREALQWGYRDALREHGELLESLGVSLREAAYRGDDVAARAHVLQARLVVIDAVGVVKDLEKVNREWSPFMPLWIGDYLKDTSHLCAAEHGAYLLLIMHYWQAGSLPTEDRHLAMIARMEAKEWKKHKSTIAAFFDPQWRHKRINKELTESAIKSSQAKRAAIKRWEKEKEKDAIAYANGHAGE